ncbi:Hypothetical protein PHPALM_20078 [Phytophthora palmivora]|uniref:Uncharacterized protein n=1 Tax=Phytophthora palmivora TaxID=4796 RepID=A0A2P4XFS1_9STRA|nr:Hypothetical protein PHPALM_20078 [Phytophthora palmivora]
MVRVPESVGDSGFHRESQEDVEDVEQGEQAPSDLGSTMMPMNESRSADQQNARRNTADGREGNLDPDPDLEEKPLHPQVPAGTPADLDASRDASTKQGKVKAEPYRLIGSPVEPLPYPSRDLPISKSDKKKPKKKLTLSRPQMWTTKMKSDLNPEPDQDKVGPTKI